MATHPARLWYSKNCDRFVCGEKPGHFNVQTFASDDDQDVDFEFLVS